jgi:flagellar protein FlgJ
MSQILSDPPIHQVPRTAPRDAGVTKAREAAEKFEAFFLYSALQQMQPVDKQGGLLNDNNAVRTFNQFLHENMANEIAKSGGIGVADMVEKELLKFQEDRH